MNDQALSEQERAELEELREFWRGAGRRLVEESLPALEATAQHVMTSAGLLAGLYTGALGITNLAGGMSAARVALYLAPLIVWLGALVAAMMVSWRATYDLNLRDAVQIRQQVHAIMARKQRWVRVAMVCLALGVAALLPVLMDYLGRL